MLATCLFAMAAVQTQPATMTLETPVMTAPAVIQMVADASGLKLAAEPSMANDVLVIKVKDADVQGVLDRIALVTCGKWADREGVMTLVPDAAARKAAVDTTFTETVQALEKTLTQWENPPADESDVDYGEMTEEQLRNLKAMQQLEREQQRAFAQLVRMVGVKRIAALDPGERIVFSDQPTPAQVRLNGRWSTFYDIVAARMKNGDYQYSGDMGEGQEGVPPEMAEFMALQRAMTDQVKPFDGVPVKFLLAVQRPSDTGMYGNGTLPLPNMTLYAMDKNGTATYVSNLALDGYGVTSEAAVSVPAAGATEQEAEDTQAVPPGRPIKFTPEEAELGMGMYGSPMPEKALARLLSSFVDPTKDPLDPISGTILRRVAETADLDVVANVPDSIAGMRYMLSAEYNQNATIEALLQNMNYSGALTEEKDGWLTLAPRNYAQHQLSRMHRPTLANYALSLQQTGPMRLDVLAEFMYRNPYAASNPLYQMVRDLSPMANMWMGNDNPAILRFWGSLSDAQRRSLRSGQPVSVGSLSKGSRDLLSSYVYNTELPLQMPPPAVLTNYGLPARTMLSMMMFGGGMGMGGGGIRSWSNEPTESMPQGLPANGVILVESWSEICFIPSSTQINPMMPGILGATEMVMLDAYKQASPAEATEVFNALPTKATVGTRTNMSLTVTFGPQVQVAGMLSDIEIGADRRTVNLTSLPPDVKASIDNTRKQISVLETFMKFMVGEMGGGEGGQRPPP